MGHSLTIPHRRAHGMCPINGIRDLVHWRSGRDWSNEFLHGLGQGGGFAYLRFNAATPPRQVYWGVSGPRQHEYLAQLFGAEYAVLEGRSFKFAWGKACEAVDAGLPPVLGPLDMFYLHYYEGLYHERHIPIHYVLLVGYEGGNALVHDTDKEEVQTIPLGELQEAWDVSLPGFGKRNRLVTFDIPQSLTPTEVLIRQSIADQCRTMLHPPVSMVGIPAMEKLTREVAGWPEELGEEKAEASLLQMREYLNSPPDLAGNHLAAGRDKYIRFLEEAGAMAGLDFSQAIKGLGETVKLIPLIAQAIQKGHLGEAAAHMGRIAQGETEAFAELGRVVS